MTQNPNADRSRIAPTRRTVLSLGAVGAGFLALAPSAQADVTIFSRITQESGDDEARFPDILTLADGRILAVWHRATAHGGAVGEIRMSIGSADGATWSTPQRALAPDALAGIDTRDPKIGLMNDGNVVLTFFTPGSGTRKATVHYAVWKPHWSRFDAPVALTTPGFTAPGMYSHGPALALEDRDGATNQVLVPFYTGGGAEGGAHYVRATWQANVLPRLVPESTHTLLSNGSDDVAFSEPNIVQVDGTAIAVVRHGADGGHDGGDAKILRWDPYQSTPTFAVQTFTGVKASSHHLLVTSEGRILFTYGDSTRTGRPTVGMVIDDPTTNWPTQTPTALYDSGAHDQANPSSVETSPGTFLTTGYNAKPKSSSSNGGSLWLIRSHAADY